MPYWTMPKQERLKELVEEGKSIEEICEIFKRSPEALRLKIRRLGLALSEKTKVTTTTTTTLPEIKPATELISMEEMLKLLLGALKLLQSPNVTSAEIKRCRTIVSTARSYMSMLQTFERMSELEQWLVNAHAKLLQLTENQLKTCEDPVEKAKLEQQIVEMKSFLEESEAKHGYKPFQRKPSLLQYEPRTLGKM
jgi:transposase-like protein